MPQDEKTIQLTFEPKGRTPLWDKFYSEPKLDMCAVCGTKDNLSSHHVVPSLFRIHLPVWIKSKSHHDVLPCCRPCHNKYESHAYKLIKTLFSKYEIKEEREWQFINKDLRLVTSLGHIFLNKSSNKVPNKNIKHFFLGDINKDNLEDYSQNASNFEKFLRDRYYKEQFKELVDKLDNLCKIQDFIFLWRRHFVETMQPKFLPNHWNPERPILYDFMKIVD